MKFTPSKRVMVQGENDSLYGTLIENINGAMAIQLDELSYPVTIDSMQLNKLRPLIEEEELVAELV